MPSSISDYALIADGLTCALVSRTGSIDFLCLPHFDSDACFAALLGGEENGCWRVGPSGYVRSTTRRYRPDTMVLETEMQTEHGRLRIVDFMAWGEAHPVIVREVEALEGEVECRSLLRLRFGYGRTAPWLQPVEGGVCADAGPHQVVLHAPCPLELSGGDVVARFTLRQGDTARFSLSYSPSYAPAGPAPDAAALLGATEQAWRGWIGRFDKPSRWAEPIKRSLLVLRSLVDRRTGGLVAAATLGLPEAPGGSMNWDYRYCWLRDATFTLTAFLNAGYQEEARRWRDWILRAVAGRPDQMQIVYRIDGGRRLAEREAGWLGGYQGAQPVLIGNAASGQTQLDVCGELLDSFHVAEKAGVARTARDLEVERHLLEHLEGAWDKPGADIWESRGDPKCYTFSQVMAWVGVDQFVEGAASAKRGDDAFLARMRALRADIRHTILERGVSSSLGRFVQSYGGEALDASLLLLPLVGFLPASDPRIAATIAAVERELMDGGLVRRKAAKGDGRDEGAFLACSCWLADCMTLQGRKDEAAEMLERVIGLSNDVGLLSEEYDVPSRRLIGNIPQALTHLGVVNSALFQSGPVVQRGASGRPGD